MLELELKQYLRINFPKEDDAWSVEELLSNSGLMIDEKLTRAAIILLGKPVSVYKLRPAVVGQKIPYARLRD